MSNSFDQPARTFFRTNERIMRIMWIERIGRIEVDE